MQVSSTASLPAPTGGWNTRDPWDQMDPKDAIHLDNWFPETSYCRIRKGHVAYADTGTGTNVDTLFAYPSGQRLLAASGGEIWDVSDPNAVVSLASGYTSDKWLSAIFSTGGGEFLIAGNTIGDAPWVYDGATITPLAVVGVAATALGQPLPYQQRMFYVETGTMSVWYTTAGAYQGALTEFDFGPLCKKGGGISAIGTWTRDNGAGGADDLFVVVTNQGEVLLYTGYDPASVWALVGIFACGKPVENFEAKCLVNTGPDLVLLCADGFQPLSDYLQYGETRAGSTDISRKIGNAAQTAVAQYGDESGWQGLIYGYQSMLIINIPQGDDTTFVQYVGNTTTGAWCRFKGMNARCWATYEQVIYFGGNDGVVYQGLIGVTDNGADIVAEMVTSYQYVGGRGANKQFLMARPVMQVNGPLAYSLNVAVDYQNPGVLPTINSNLPVAGTWGSGTWGVSLWGTSQLTLQRQWSGVSGIGYAVAVQMKVSTHTVTATVNSFDLMYQPGWAL